MSGTNSGAAIVSRDVTVVGGESGQARPLADFRSERSYVLLGDPGAGKTTALQMEADADPDGLLVTARRFVRRSLDQHPEWRGKNVFIDGLDEVRAGSPDARSTIDEIVDRLQRLQSPKFRLSCRSADWLGRNDLEQIVSTAGYGGTHILHLEPLGDEEVRAIAKSLCGGDPEAFLSKASDRGLGGLLGNPHLLKLLVRAVRDGNWPDGRLATFAQACEMWVREHNEEHSAANRNAPPVSVEETLDATGHLCALLLLSDRDYASPDETGDAEALPLGDVRGGARDGYGFALRRALRSPMFVADTDGGRVPAHRQIAEFLAARHLGTLIESGLPASRVLALLAGFDGVVVPELRGLAAWLAAFNSSARAPLIETDPVGVALHGDVGAFTKDERERLLRAFGERADEIRVWDWPEAALTSLVDRYTPGILAAYLREDDRSEGTQEVAYLLLTALSRTSVPLPLDTGLVATVRDGSWRSHVRSMSLRALLRRREHDPSCLPDLMSLLDDLRGGRVKDRNHELLGLLLWYLYPDQIGPGSVWDYLLPDDVPLGGSYGFFWRSQLVDKTGDDAPALVDALYERGTGWLETGPYDAMSRVVHKLVQRALRVSGDVADTERVLNWLELIGFEAFVSGPSSEALRAIREWLTARPDMQKQLALNGLGRHGGRENYRPWAWSVRWAEFGAAAPGQGSPALRTDAEQLAMPPPEPIVTTVREEAAEYVTAAEREKADVVSAVRDQRGQLPDGKCAPALLDRLASAYHDTFHDQPGADPESRLLGLLDGDRGMVRAAFSGFRRVLERDDLPSLREIIRLDEDNRRSFFALPLLAGLDLLGSTALQGRDAATVLRAIGIYYVTPVNPNQLAHPAWYDAIRQTHPDLVAEVLVKVTRSRIRRKEDCHYLWRLARDPAYRKVTRIAAPKLWRGFPTKCTEPQILALRELLRAGVRWEADGIEEALRRRIDTDLDVAQRALWLSAGLLVSPVEYAPLVVSFVQEGEEARGRHIVDFLAPADDGYRLPMPSGTRELRSLITLVGRRYEPWVSEAKRSSPWTDGSRMKAEQLIHRWTRRLAARTDDASVAALEALVSDASLKPWQTMLRRAGDAQIVARRSATFATPNLAAVQRNLSGGPPASAADLTAFVAVAFEEIGEHLRHGDTDRWRQFWDEPISSADKQPKHENFCRDRLLDALRPKLPPGVDARREGNYAEDRRADIRVSYGGFAIPVEIKKNRYRKLWSAASDQLVAKYARDPESDGYGIYLVLWLERERTPVPPSGPRPKTPDELRDRLETGLADRDRVKVSVVVLDVSRRETAK